MVSSGLMDGVGSEDDLCAALDGHALGGGIKDTLVVDDDRLRVGLARHGSFLPHDESLESFEIPQHGVTDKVVGYRRRILSTRRTRVRSRLAQPPDCSVRGGL